MSNQTRAWSWRNAILDSDLPGDCRHILLTLSCFMNEMGEGCYPSIDTLAAKSGKSRRTVIKYLNHARDEGWIGCSQVKITRPGVDNRGWKRNEYFARWPGRDMPDSDPEANNPPDSPSPDNNGPDHTPEIDKKGGAPHAPPSQKGGASGAEGGAPDDKKVVRHTHPNSSGNQLIDSLNARARADGGEPPEREGSDLEDEGEENRDDPKKFEQRVKRLGHAHPDFIKQNTGWAVARFAELSDAERAEAEARHGDYLAAAGNHPVALGCYFRDRKWDELPPPGEVSSGPQALAPFGKEWGVARLALLLSGPERPAPPESGFLQKWHADPVDGAARRRDYRARHCWPTVNAMDDAARHGRGWIDRGGDDPPAALRDCAFETFPAGSESWARWHDWHERLGFPPLPEVKEGVFVWMPQVDPFEAFPVAALDGTVPDPPEPDEADDAALIRSIGGG